MKSEDRNVLFKASESDISYSYYDKNQKNCIFLWSVPANGHLNPTLCFTNQLLLRLPDMNANKLVFYSGPSFKDLILNLPNNIGKNLIEFRDYRLEKYTGTENLLKLLMNFNTKPGTLFRAFKCFENSVKLGSKHIFKSLLEDMYNDKPMLIIYDQALFFPKLALNLYEKRYKCKQPLHAAYVTTFLCAQGIYPYLSDLEKMGMLGDPKPHSKVLNILITVFDLCKYIFTYYKTLIWDFGFSMYDVLHTCNFPLSKSYLIDSQLNLVFVMPEIQPRLEKFQANNIKFVGPSVDESVRNSISKEKFDMSKYIDLIDKFLEKNMISNINNDDKKNSNIEVEDVLDEEYEYLQPEIKEQPKSILMRSDSSGENFKKAFKPIIYVSMGTVFNNENSDLFKVLVEACKFFSKDYAIIVSTGDEKAYEKYIHSTLNSESILFVPHTPQVEILKRTHLFITHAGMNSVSEAINYGVPIICLPLSGDQPFVAWRVADELGMGIRLQPDRHLTIERVKNTINEILNNPVYRERVQKFSAISKRYSGHKDACEHVVEFILKKIEQADESENSNVSSKITNYFTSLLKTTH